MATHTTAQLCSILLLFFSIFSVCVAQHQPFVIPNVSKKQYEEMVNSGEHFLVNFGTIGCIKCKEFEPEYQKVFDHFSNDPTVTVVKMNDINIVRKLGLQKVPSVMFFRHGVPIVFEGQLIAEDLLPWVEENMESFTVHLKDDDFEHLTQSSSGSTTGDWLVQFYNLEVARCLSLQPVWESVAYKLKGQTNVASVNITANPKLVKRFKIKVTDVPVIILFRHGKQYDYTLPMKDSPSLVTFAETGYKHAQGIDVMPPPSPFDELTESIALQIKSIVSGEGSSTVLLVAAVAFALIFVVILVCLCRGGGNVIQEMGTTKKSV